MHCGVQFVAFLINMLIYWLDFVNTVRLCVCVSVCYGGKKRKTDRGSYVCGLHYHYNISWLFFYSGSFKKNGCKTQVNNE